ncbi:ABC transporter ATP-binding protein [Haloferula helveola]|uniref:ABC transporter ATP-binding protein n=1 Tax=Haloferula helveola TaxID=490095 RepID=A0ABM7RFT0_9BACT|nr:ABC transporter ATP-binding protein [Haloferula helveola]
MSSDTPQLQLSPGLTIGYRAPLARTAESIQLGKGTHFLLARNGRGKTTLLRTIARSIRQLGGEIRHHGRMQYMAEGLYFDAELSASAIFRAMIPRKHLAEALQLAERIELDLKKPYGKLSTGNRRKTSLIVAEYSVDPAEANILLLDEPFSGLDAYARQQFEEIWRTRSNNTLRLVSCHPDYDSMEMPSALIIQDETILQTTGESQTWNELKSLLN